MEGEVEFSKLKDFEIFCNDVFSCDASMLESWGGYIIWSNVDGVRMVVG